MGIAYLLDKSSSPDPIRPNAAYDFIKFDDDKDIIVMANYHRAVAAEDAWNRANLTLFRRLRDQPILTPDELNIWRHLRDSRPPEPSLQEFSRRATTSHRTMVTVFEATSEKHVKDSKNGLAFITSHWSPEVQQKQFDVITKATGALQTDRNKMIAAMDYLAKHIVYKQRNFC